MEPCEGAQEGWLKEPRILTSAGENLSAWVRRSCLNLREGVSGEQWGEPGGASCTGRGWRLLQPRWSAPPPKQRGPQRTGGHPHKGTHLPPCFQHGAPSHPLRCPTYSSLFTTPLPLGSKRRKALRMASSGSVPGRPRQPGKHPHSQLPSPTEEEPGVREGTFHITERGEGYPIQSAPWGSEKLGSAIFLK